MAANRPASSATPQRRFRRTVALALAAALLPAAAALADQGGASFWLPGQYASFAALAPDPGWSLPATFYGYSGSVAAGRLLGRGNLLAAGLKSSLEELFLQPTYTLDTTILGARPSFSVALVPGYAGTAAEVRLGPLSESRSDSVFGLGNLSPTANLFWSAGFHNVMVYVTGVALTGNYDPNRLSNLGLGHAAIDGGGAYTYYNTKTNTEVSATLGFTRNFESPSAHYTSGVDSHLDLGASQFLTDKFFIGVVGYYYQQLTADQGQPPILGAFESRVRAAGPQLGYNFDLGNGATLSTNLRGYAEFDAHDRTQGYAIFASATVPLSALFKGK
jgi:hypothetical protein